MPETQLCLSLEIENDYFKRIGSYRDTDRMAWITVRSWRISLCLSRQRRFYVSNRNKKVYFWKLFFSSPKKSFFWYAHKRLGNGYVSSQDRERKQNRRERKRKRKRALAAGKQSIQTFTTNFVRVGLASISIVGPEKVFRREIKFSEN